MSEHTLAVHGLTKTFTDHPVLDGVDLTLAQGSITAVVGASGCGKTTLLRLVAGFEAPDAGTIDIGGRRVASATSSLAPHRRSVGYVAQDGALFPHLNVGANIAYGLPGRARSAARPGPASTNSSKPFPCHLLSRHDAPTSYQVVSSSVSHSPAPWHGSRPSCCSTNRSPHSTPGCAPRPAKRSPRSSTTPVSPPCW